MFRTLCRTILPNRLDWLCRKAARKKWKRVLIAWNRGLGDIPLGLFALVHRIRTFLPNADISFLFRKDLQEGFSLLRGVHLLPAPDWQRNAPYSVLNTLRTLGISHKEFDWIIPYPKPADWVRWQYGTLTPKLTWNEEHDALADSGLFTGTNAVAIHLSAETDYGLWRNWPLERWKELCDSLEQDILLFGHKKDPPLEGKRMIDLRGKTTLLELLSIIKNRCSAFIAPDSGLLSMVYYLDASFPLRLISLWADPNHGILKQGVASPNPQLIHIPLISQRRDLSTLSAQQVLCAIKS